MNKAVSLGIIFLVGLLFNCLPSVSQAQATSSNSPVQTIWKTTYTEGNSPDYDLVYYGNTGLYWLDKEHDEIYVYNGKAVKKLTNLKETIIDQIKDNQATITLVSTSKNWDKFEIRANRNGKMEKLFETNGTPFDLQINYPLVTWKMKGWATVKGYTYDLNTWKEVKSGVQVKYVERNPSFYKYLNEFQGYVMRPFEFVDVGARKGPKENEIPHATNHSSSTFDQLAMWKEPSGVFLDYAGDKEGTYRRISTVPGLEGRIAVNHDYAVWSLNQGLGIFSFDKNLTYLVHSKLLGNEPKDSILFDNQAAILERIASDQYAINLVNLDQLIQQSKSAYIQIEKPEIISPTYLAEVVTTLAGPPYQFTVSPNYLLYKKEYFDYHFYQRNKQTVQLIDWNGFGTPVFIGDTLYVSYEDMSFPDEEYEEENGIFRMNLETGEDELLYKLEKRELPHELKVNNGKLYWYVEEEKNIYILDPQTKELEKRKLDSNYMREWSMNGNQVVWIDRMNQRNYKLYYQNGSLPVQTLKQWTGDEWNILEFVLAGDRLYYTSFAEGNVSIHVIDIATKKDSVLVESAKEQKYYSKLSLQDDFLYYLYGRDLTKYNFITGQETHLASQIAAYEVLDNRLVSVKLGKGGVAYYLLDQPLNEVKDISVHYTWQQVEQNNQKLWNDIRFTFHSDDILFTLGNKSYRWTEVMQNQKLWNNLMKQKSLLGIQVKL